METFTSIIVDLALFGGCVLAADFLTGLMHWAEDTWLSLGRSEFMDRVIVRDNIEHHRRPGSIRAGTYWQTNGVCIVLAGIAAGAFAIFHVHAWEPYLVALLLSHSNQVHRWAHSSNVPRVVRALQSVGVLQSPAHHARHHKNPFASHFCAGTNFLNPMLEAIGLWRALEWTIERFGPRVRRATEARGGY